MSAPAATAAAPAPDGRAPLGAIPGSFRQALLMSRYQFRDYLRSRRFVLMMAIVAVLSVIIIAVLAHYRPPGLTTSTTAYYGSFWVSGSELLIVFSGIIFGGDAIAGEFQNKTGYFLMGLPVKRWSVYAGKYMAAYLASAITLVVYLVILIANGTIYFGASFPAGAVFDSFLLSLVYLSALLGTVFLFSSLFKTSLYAVLVVAVMFLFGFSILEALIVGLVGIEPWFIVTYANAVIGYPFSGVPIHHAFGVYNPTYAEGIAIMIGYFLGTALAGFVLFEREEFT